MYILILCNYECKEKNWIGNILNGRTKLYFNKAWKYSMKYRLCAETNHKTMRFWEAQNTKTNLHSVTRSGDLLSRNAINWSSISASRYPGVKKNKFLESMLCIFNINLLASCFLRLLYPSLYPSWDLLYTVAIILGTILI